MKTKENLVTDVTTYLSLSWVRKDSDERLLLWREAAPLKRGGSFPDVRLDDLASSHQLPQGVAATIREFEKDSWIGDVALDTQYRIGIKISTAYGLLLKTRDLEYESDTQDYEFDREITEVRAIARCAHPKRGKDLGIFLDTRDLVGDLASRLVENYLEAVREGLKFADTTPAIYMLIGPRFDAGPSTPPAPAS